MKQQPVFAQTPQQPTRITQWIIGKSDFSSSRKEGIDYRNLLLPTLAWRTHHNNERWVTWIASQFIERAMLEQYDVNLSSLRMIVDSHSSYSSFKLLLTALRNNRSSMVIASLPDLSDTQHRELEQAATQGDCKAIILIH